VTTPDRVVRFIEKPDAACAAELFTSRRTAWNTMVLVAHVRTLWRCFARRVPALARDLLCLVARDGAARLDVEEYAALDAANFSADVLAASDGLRVLLLPAAAGWTDLGTEPRLTAWLARRRSLPRDANFGQVG
jgi:mannose-1-phosphate guanylyltransferase/mannose-1-phosphate guanylyltransferase/mannose-6-phosphate isomerase